MSDLKSAQPLSPAESPQGGGDRRAYSVLTVFQKAARFREGGVLLALVVLCVLLTVGTPKFLTPYNLGIVVRQIAFVATVALGQTLVLLTGGIDLSVGPVAGLSSILGAMLVIFGALYLYYDRKY